MTLDSLPPLSEVIRSHDLRAKKTLGQNFILDFNILQKIVRQAGDVSEATVLEVGAGPGGLTRTLLSQGASVLAIERDERCIPALEEIKTLYPERLKIINDDALNCNFMPVLKDWAEGRDIKIISNLPYNIASKLFVDWLSSDHPFFWSEMILMFQREVAQRICSQQGDKHWGRLGLLSSLLSETESLFDLAPSAFTPPPKVTSSVVRIVPRKTPIPCDFKTFEAISKTAFGQRRKMLRQSLKPLGGEALLEAAGIDPQLRAQDLELEDFVKLTNCLEKLGSRAVDHNNR